MTKEREVRCNLEIIEDDTIQCRALCLIHNDMRCCEECNETKICKRVCGFIRDRNKRMKTDEVY